MFATTTDYTFGHDFATRSAELAAVAAQDRLGREARVAARAGRRAARTARRSGGRRLAVGVRQHGVVSR